MYYNIYGKYKDILLKLTDPLSCWTRICSAFANSVDPDQLASKEANWSQLIWICIQFVIKNVKICINNLDQEIWLAECEK